jgi:hypothetical protein
MLPVAYELPAAILIFVGGVLACFAGYRLFRVVLAIYGFILGAMLASSMMGISNTAGMVAAAIIGGLVGAVIFVFAYYVGIALIGAGLGALIAHAGWATWGPASAGPNAPADPPAILVIALAVIGAVGAMWLQRYVIIVGTAFGGAWTMIVGAMAIVGSRELARAAAAGKVWILYPLEPGTRRWWLPLAWVALALIGTGVQLGVTGRKR